MNIVESDKMLKELMFGYDDESKFKHYILQGLIKCEKDIFSRYLDKKDIVLDVGCYVGRVSIEIANQCSEIVGIDIVRDAIKIAEELRNKLGIKNCKFLVASATHLPFKDKTFDKVLIPYNTLECISLRYNRLKVLKECYRVLKEDGLLIFSTHNRYYTGWLRDLIKLDLIRVTTKIFGDSIMKKVLRTFKKNTYIDIDMIIKSELHSVIWKEPDAIKFTQYYFYSKKEIINSLKQIGFEIMKIYPIGHQNPYSPEGKMAEILNENNIFKIPGFYFIAKRR